MLFQAVGWNLKAMETRSFLVGYDRTTGFAKAIHLVPDALVVWARSIAGLASELPGDWPVPPAAALHIASVMDTEIDAGMEFFLEPHQDPAIAEAPAHSIEAGAALK
jgi:hypothetical protein